MKYKNEETMSHSQIIYRLCKSVLLLVSGAMLLCGVSFAQTTSDVTITAIATEAHCLKDGTVAIDVKKKPGAVHNIQRITYNLYDAKGNSLAGTPNGEYVANSIFSGLGKGIYKAYAKVLFDSGVELVVGPATATVTTDYKIPTVAIKMERKTLRSFKPNGTGSPQPTGIVSVRITGGNRPDYKVKITEAPGGYTGVREIALDLDKTIYFYNLPKGTYKFQVYDACGGQEVQTINMQEVAFDTPKNGVLPYQANPKQSPELRMKACGWFYYPYARVQRSEYVKEDQDLQPYLSPTGQNLSTAGGNVSPLDTIAKYYNYGFAYGDAKPSRYYTYNEVTFNSSTPPSGIAASDGSMRYLGGRIKDGVSWDAIGGVAPNPYNKDAFPALFLRVKGSPDEMPEGYRRPRKRIGSTKFITHWLRLIDPCRADYHVYVRASNEDTELFCFPLKVRLYAANKMTPLSDEETIYMHDRATTFKNYTLHGGTQYYIKGEDGRGSKVEISVRIENEFIYRTWVKPSANKFDVCNRKRGIGIDIFRGKPLGTSFLKHKVTITKAPAGYVPEEDGLAVGETFTFPDTFPTGEPADPDRKDDRFFPFGKKSDYFRKNREIYAPNGKYEFKIEDACGKVHTVTATVESAKTPEWTVRKENFKPRLVNASCGRVRIYPFRKENKDNFMFKSEFYDEPASGGSVGPFIQGPVSTPGDLMIYVKKFPTGLNQNDVTHNFRPESRWSWIYHNAIWWYSKTDNPEDVYIELPKTNDKIVLKVAPFSRNYEYNRVFKDLDCMPEYEIDLSNVPLSYDRESYIGYTCKGSLSGRLYIVPVNNVGPVRIDLYKEGESTPFATETLAKDKVHDGANFTLQGTAGNPIPGKLLVKMTDLECDIYNDEHVIIYNLESPDIVKTPNQQRKYCEGETIKLSVMNLGTEVRYTWTLPNGDVRTGRSIEIPNATAAHSGEYTIKIENTICGTDTSVKFYLSVAPTELWWRKDAEDSNWHNLNNWAKRDGTPVQAVPAPCTVVHIPAMVDKAFPNLAGDVTKRDVYGEPECNDIYFHYGAQLGTPQLLSYSKAFVDYNFGMNKPQGTEIYTPYEQPGHPKANGKLLERNRWYMIATPLKETPAGDFGLGGHPRSYQRYLKVSAQEPLSEASFVKPFNSYLEPLKGYNNAMALRVAGSTPSTPLDADAEAYLNGARGIIRLPLLYEQDRFEKDTRKLAYQAFARQLNETDILFTYYNDRTLALTNKAETYTRLLPDAFRFVFETNDPGKKGRIGSLLLNGKYVEGYTLESKPIGVANDWIMLGNPFMTPMDFDKFYEVNQDKIEPYYYLFSENAWRVYTKGTSPISGLGKQIAPLQSIVVKRKAVGNLVFPTSGNVSVLLPSWDQSHADHYSVKSDEILMTTAETPLMINVSNREGDYSQAFLGWSSEMSIPAFINNEYAHVPTVFLVEPDTRICDAITYPKQAYGTIDLGVSSSLSSPLTLSFDHIDRSVYEELTLVDRYEGIEQDLLVNPKYDFIHKPDPTAITRFALRLKRFGITNVLGNEDSALAELKMYDVTGRLRIESSSLLHRVVVYDIQGKTLADEVLTDNATRTVEVDTNNTYGVVVVEVFFSNGMRTVRKYDLR